MIPDGLIDDKNGELWAELNQARKITVLIGDRDVYGCYSINNESEIYVPKGNIDSASFTHELLHIYLRVKKILIGTGFKMSVRENQLLSNIISDGLVDHVGNCLDHIKMFPIFLEMGYSRNQFLSDYSIDKLTKDHLSLLSTMLFKDSANKVYRSWAIDSYIGRFFAAKACVNDSIDYVPGLLELKSLEPDLYKILDDFWNNWVNWDIDDQHPAGYHLIEYNFCNNLKNWISSRKIE